MIVAFHRRTVLAVTLFCVALSALMLVQTRNLFLDDTFIHLRIASNLAARDIYSYNGDVPSYSTSSPLYTALLATLWKLLPIIWLPKIVGIAAYASLLMLIGLPLLRIRGSARPAIYLAWFIAITSPMAIRWLTDGMETALVATTSVVLGSQVAALRLDASYYPTWLCCSLGLLALVATLLRVEFAYVVALGACAFLADALWQRTRLSGVVRLGLLSLVAGSLLSLMAVTAYFGNVLPDTALAKAGASAASVTLIDSIKAHLAASLFGVGMLVAWLISFWNASRAPGQRFFVAAMNAGLPLLLVLIALRHQDVQGYRYFVFIEFFLVSVNTALVASGKEISVMRDQSRWRPIGLLGLTVMLVAWESYDWHRLDVLSAGRSTTFEKFLQGDLSYLHGKRGLAWDVGMIGYFSQSTILDSNGLINGREMARLPAAERLRRLTATPVDFVFANDDQLAQLRGLIETRNWHLLGEYQFPNFSGYPDTHYLLVRDLPDAADLTRAASSPRH
jgi:hypothetical protein